MTQVRGVEPGVVASKPANKAKPESIAAADFGGAKGIGADQHRPHGRILL
jgi:hypothetical protein